MIDRDDLIEELAVVSHETWMRQKSRDQNVPIETLSKETTDHDRERAEDTVRALERLGVFEAEPIPPA